jgi:sulfotransferase
MLHQLKPQVSYEPRTSVLPPDQVKMLQELDFWNSLEGTDAKVLRST